MEWYMVPAVILVGFAAGFINTLAGGGSALSMPLLIFLGLPVNVANGTNRIAILLQCAVGTAGFAKEKITGYRGSLSIIIASILGSIPGALIANRLSEVLMERIVGVVLVIMLLLIVFKPDIWLKSRYQENVDRNPVLSFIIFFLIGIYGGFIQIGIGFFLLAGLVLIEKKDLIRSNALKLLITLLFTPFALVVFIINKQVDFKLGLLLAAGNMAGAWVGARAAVKKGTGFVRWVLIISLVISILKLFDIF